MPTKTQAKKLPATFDGARSAVAKGGFSTSLDGRAYIIAAKRRLPVDHPLVAAAPDRFAPSGEVPDANPRGRDLTPKPTRVQAAAVVTATARCAEPKPCGWTTDGDPDTVVRAAASHCHTVPAADAK